MVVTGYTGQVSLGHAAFLAVGAYAHAYFISHDIPFVFLSFGISHKRLVGLVLRFRSRMTGLYLAIASLAFAIIVEDMTIHWESVTGGNRGMSVPPPSSLATKSIALLNFTILFWPAFLEHHFGLNLLRAPLAAMMAIRDSEISASSLGISVARTKITAFS